jgi:hypothetical protein
MAQGETEEAEKETRDQEGRRDVCLYCIIHNREFPANQSCSECSTTRTATRTVSTQVRDLTDSEVTAALDEVVGAASADEARILLFLARRFVIFGPGVGYKREFIDDDRDDEAEEAEEVGDSWFYYAKRLLRKVTQKR